MQLTDDERVGPADITALASKCAEDAVTVHYALEEEQAEKPKTEKEDSHELMMNKWDPHHETMFATAQSFPCQLSFIPIGHAEMI